MSNKRFDLNLMSVFCAVMAEGSVTRAASRLSMTQPAVSNSLRRLRYLLQDELFIRSPNGIIPTEKAKEIWPDIQSALDQIAAIAMPPDFIPANTSLTFNVAMTDTIMTRVVPELASRFIRDAPLAKLHFHPHATQNSIIGLQRGALDCAVGMFPAPDPTLMTEAVLADDYVCVFRHEHPNLSVPLTLKQFAAARHILVKHPTSLSTIDTWLNLVSVQRDIGLVVNTAAQALQVACENDLAAAVPRSFVLSMPQSVNLQIADLPFRHEPILYKMLWHQRADRDPPRVWLRQLVRDVIAETCKTASSG